MVVRTIVLAAWLASLAAGADANRANLFTIRTLFNDSKLDKLASRDLMRNIAVLHVMPGEEQCAIPLKELKAKSADKGSLGIGDRTFDEIAKAPPIRACLYP